MRDRVPLLLLTNDDGITSPGIEALETSLQGMGEIYVVAPDRERNASSHSLTLGQRLYVNPLGPRHFSVTGTPTDCVNLAVHRILPSRPDLVISGINKGANLAEDVTYSGTVAAALEARLLGIDSVAISLVSRERFCFESAAFVSLCLTQWILSRRLPQGIFLNVNVPNVESGACSLMKLTRLGRKEYSDFIEECSDAEGKICFRFGRDAMRFLEDDGASRDADWKAVDMGFVSVTPLRVNMTDEESLEVLKAHWVSGGMPFGES